MPRASRFRAGHRIVHVSGQVGVTLAGEIPTDPARQHELAWENALAVLAAAGMDHPTSSTPMSTSPSAPISASTARRATGS